MKHLLIAALLPFTLLAGCNGSFQWETLVNDLKDPNVEVCASALIQSGIIDPAALAITAATTPACIALAEGLVQQIIADVSQKNQITSQRQLRYHD